MKESGSSFRDIQTNEITEYEVYSSLSRSAKSNSEILQNIAQDELQHYNFWKKYSGKDFPANKVKVFFYVLISKIFGLTFALKLMENGEKKAEKVYDRIAQSIPEVRKVKEEEDLHERELLSMINEERLNYVGSIVLGLNDALVELTGTLAGLTLAFQQNSLISLSGLITGIAASLSMAASEYLSTRTEEGSKNALKASIYTGITYVITTIFLVLPFFLIANPYVSIAVTIGFAITAIALFTYYISVVRDSPFSKGFIEMTSVSLGVAFVSFLIGLLVRKLFGVQI